MVEYMVARETASLHVIDQGPVDAPAITFSNSLMTDTRLWEAQARHLSDRFRVIRYDQRGHGRSDIFAGAYTFDDLADDIIAIWDHLGIARSHVVGLSMGGMTALGLALRNPGRLLSCTMCSMRADAPEAFQRSWDERLALARAQGMPALSEPTARRWFPEGYKNDAVLSLVRRMISETPVQGFLGGVGAICALDYARQVAALDVQVQFLAGGCDGVLPDAMARLAGEVRESRYEQFPGTGHLINLERPEEFNRAIGCFLD